MDDYKNSSIPVTEEAAKGAAPYSKFNLALYDIQVLHFEVPVFFGCPLRKIRDLFNENVSGNHLDIGVGTGYFLDKGKFPVDKPTIHLMDLNINSLEKTSDRIKRYQPTAHHWNVLEPFKKEVPVFNSVSANNFLHCLPGTMLQKEVFFKNLTPHLHEGGVCFGTTVLGKDVKPRFLLKKINSLYNKMSVFCNLDDDAAGLETVLANNFSRFSVEVVGSVALFKGVK